MASFFCPGTLVEYESSPQGADDFMQRYVPDKVYGILFYGTAQVRFTVYDMTVRVPRYGTRNFIAYIRIYSEVAGVSDRFVHTLEHAINCSSVVGFLALVKRKINAAILCLMTEFFVVYDKDYLEKEAKECLEVISQLLQ